ncbi:MAG: ABC transporter ATP-binding protein [Vitreoscilla sp.]|nr:ABC transporter ATP-binding protein [Vitreoscilla sp.]
MNLQATQSSAQGSTQAAAQATAPATVAIQNLSLAYGAQTVLQNLSWQLPPGQVVGLLGRNGAGKTTLLESLLGLREPAQGEVQLFGRPLAALGDAERARIGYVPQQSNLFEWMTPLQLLAYFKAFYPRWNDAKVEALLTRWGINRHQPIAKLSGGQQQRLSIIRALGHEPDLLVLDEPVASLDPAGRRDFLQELVAQVIDRGTTVVFSTHILSDLERVAFHVAFLAAGRIVLQAPLDELMDGARSITGPSLAVHQQVQAQGWQVLGETPLGHGQTRLLARREGDAAAATWPGTEVTAVSLEDLFLGLTQ